MVRSLFRVLLFSKKYRNFLLLFCGLMIAALEMICYHELFRWQFFLQNRYSCYLLSLTLGTLFFLIPKNKKSFACIAVVLSVIYFLLALHTGFLYGNGSGFSVENFIYLNNTNLLIDIWRLNPNYFWEIPLLVLLLVLLSFCTGLAMYLACCPRPEKNVINRALQTAVLLGLIFLQIQYFCPLQDVLKIFSAASTARKYLDMDAESYRQLGIKITGKNAEDAKASPGKNLVFIILESTELAYLDESRFPGLLPFLKAFQKTSQCFQNVRMAPNAQLTFGAMFSMMTGTVLTNEHLLNGMNSHVNPNVGNRFSSLPLLLNKAGYRQFFLAGHSGHFAGTGNFVAMQKYDSSWFGIDNSRRVLAWDVALRDSKVYQKAWEVFQQAAQQKKPFHITMFTLDAHGPSGFHDPREARYHHPGIKPSQLFDAMYASDQAMGKFLDRIRRHPAGKDTCIVIVSDHLAHAYSDSTPVLARKPNRKLLFLIQNSAVDHYDPNSPGMTFDIAPTILDALGVRHDWTFPLGESLYAPENRMRLISNEEQNAAILAYTMLKSTPATALTQGVKLQEKPYPAIAAGELNIPLQFDGMSPRLAPGDNYLIPVPPTRVLQSVRQIHCSSAQELQNHIRNTPECLFVAALRDEKNSGFRNPPGQTYLLGIKLNGKKRIKYADHPDKLVFSPDEIEALLKSPAPSREEE